MKLLAGVAKHSESSFNESDANRYLAGILEKDHTIKTFFKENDRTPNYDGSFELVSGSGEPKKQFIVQIKKTRALDKIGSGKNKGKYVYDLETPFLYYIKEKVTESPAVYFVVDIVNKRIFYLYLSDETLMALNFEEKERVRYAFSDKDILSDIGQFYRQMDAIANSRNQRYLYRSEEDIVEMQEAIEYLNTLLNSDMRVIKEHRFPGLWRFGIGISQSSEFEIRRYSPEVGKESGYKPETTNMFCLYPQYKGKVDPDVSEFRNTGYFQTFDCAGKTTPMAYVKNNLNKIIGDFCQNPPPELLPTSVLLELTAHNAFVIHGYFSEDDDTIISTEVSLVEIHVLFQYIDHLRFENPVTDAERKFQHDILTTRRVDLFNPETWSALIGDLQKYASEHKTESQYKIHANAIFDLVGANGVKYYCMVSELSKRSVDSIQETWKYNPLMFWQKDNLSEDDVLPVCEQWFGNLPDIYLQFYENVFPDISKYKFSRKVEYSLEIGNEKKVLPRVLADARVYNGVLGQICIEHVDAIGKVFSEEDKVKGLRHISSGDLFCPSLLNMNPTLYYDGIRCFLYQGICDALDFECKGIKINSRHIKIFY